VPHIGAHVGHAHQGDIQFIGIVLSLKLQHNQPGSIGMVRIVEREDAVNRAIALAR